MASSLQIRNVPDDVRRTLKARAAARSQSLNAYLLNLVEREVARPTVAEVMEQASSRAKRTGSSAVEVVRVSREERDEEILRRS